MKLRMITYMTPSLPLEFFQYLCDLAAQRLGLEVELLTDTSRSGPTLQQFDSGSDPYSRGEAEVGFQCAPSYLKARDREEPILELAGVAPLFGDVRNQGCAVYHSEVVVAADSDIVSFEDLRGRSWGYNDPESLSGYYAALHRLSQQGETVDFFGQVDCAGSHLASLEKILTGEVDGAAIDSNTLHYWLEENPGRRAELRIIEQLGPHSIQPIVLSCAAEESLRADLRDFFKGLGKDTETLAVLKERFWVEGFPEVDDSHYDRERQILKATEHLKF